MTETKLTRRNFVQISALGATAAAVGATLAGCMQESASSSSAAEESASASASESASESASASASEPQSEVPQAEALAPSTEGLTKMRTSCHGCIQMCPAIAYLKDGVVVRLEGDPEAPVSRGGLCAKGLNQLHTMYSPRRVLHPLKRAGERGENKWEIISWEQAVDEAATAIADSIEKYGPYSFMASVGGGGAYSFMEAMTLPMALGSPTVIEPGCAQCYLPRWSMSKLFYGGND
ncbi:MAG: molybdopterin-dependent oxidoreductase, partial [Eggerthellaceae bacterium]|nr:molybdopterin-dependent oxidoreductase [Eggerthellaceae bacterium]